MKDELNLEELDNVIAGTLNDLSEDIALENSDIFRKKQIDKLKSEREFILNMKDNDELSLEELDKIKGGFHK